MRFQKLVNNINWVHYRSSMGSAYSDNYIVMKRCNKVRIVSTVALACVL